MNPTVAFAIALALAALAAPGAPAAEPSNAAPEAACLDCGVVLSVGETGREGPRSWRSTLGGGGDSSAGRPHATGVTPSRGSFVGRSEEFRPHPAGFTVSVRMADGSVRSIRSTTRPAVSPGDNVRVAGNVVFLR